jgi:hypothetical protein
MAKFDADTCRRGLVPKKKRAEGQAFCNYAIFGVCGKVNICPQPQRQLRAEPHRCGDWVLLFLSTCVFIVEYYGKERGMHM